MDGLYWAASPNEEQSPFGRLFAAAATEGFDLTTGHPRQPYHGYNLRVLKRQGPASRVANMTMLSTETWSRVSPWSKRPHADLRSLGDHDLHRQPTGKVYQARPGPAHLGTGAEDDSVQPPTVPGHWSRNESEQSSVIGV